MTSSRGWFYLVAIFLGGYLLYLLAPVITPFAVAGLIAYMTDPLVDRLEKWHIRNWKVGRTLAVVIVFTVMAALLAIILLVVLPLLIRQFRELMTYVPQLAAWVVDTAVPWVALQLGLEDLGFDISDISEIMKEYWRELTTAAFNVLETLGKGSMAVMMLLANLVLIPVVSFYLMRDWDKMIAGIQNLLPRSIVGPVSSLASEIDDVLGAFVRGQLMVMTGLGLIYALGLRIIGLDMAFLIGMMAGLLSIVPYLGTAVGLIVALIVALFQFGDITHVALVGVVFAVGQTVESMFLTPHLVGDRIGLHPVAVIFAVLAGGTLFGFLGILLALPVAAALNVVMRHAQELYQSSSLYTD